jgi:segregation and condensation protein A
MPIVLPTTGTLPETWKVRLPIFEGALDLLLHLIKINEVEITDIPVAMICDQFHQYLAWMEELNLDIAGDYIYMAAYLIHLKSRMLLPRPKTADGRELEEDPRDDLVARLIEYRRLKEAAQSLAEVDSVRRGMWPRTSDELKRIAKEELPELDLGEVSLFDLARTLKQVLERFAREHPEPLHLIGETFSLRDQIDRLIGSLRPGRPYDFLDDLRCLSCLREAIAAFLAVLELTRLNLIRLHQTEDGSILIYRTTREVDLAELEAIQG